jgi:hypothetical protein
MLIAAVTFLASAGIVLNEHGTSTAFKKLIWFACFCIGWLLWDLIKRGAA